ncbi:MAG: hypothetical protein GWN02_31745, partial [Gemmatimonadetes bacterium]|nr:hypothetical protein [Gemmatimonadota bacterium]NIR41454.1 hypothetical protein [Actinomycetota bacterium]NIS36488.1 hypothetical protein [Actinomycetota bacterium]NIU70991.1 hypothetical protein [Actinomycetota bacterium]NIY12563.1 hypothetical protein [Gemmatimonadota bacterium]
MALSHIWSPLGPVAASGGAPPVTGTGAGTLSAVTGDAAGAWGSTEGTAAGTLASPLTGDASGHIGASGTAAATLAALTGDATAVLGWRWNKAVTGLPSTSWYKPVESHEYGPNRTFEDPSFAVIT